MSAGAENLLDTLRLTRAEGVGPVTFRRLVRVFGSPAAVLAAPKDRLVEIPDISARIADGIRAARVDTWAEEEAARAKERGVRLVCLGDPAYPKPLLNTYDPPPVLYVQGEIQETDGLAVAIVGTRKCSAYGRAQAEKLASGLALAGFTVVSGLARGIDSSAHAGAMAQDGGRTLAVLGTGLDNIYPPENKKLFEQIVAGHGAVLSELPFNSPPSKEHFPRRNRVIAGLSLGVVVVEGDETSGALITARFAVDMDREVFAVPGSVENPNARGPHRLIKSGAKLVESVEDILDELKGVADPLVKMPAPDARLRIPSPREKARTAPLLEAAGVAPDRPATAPDVRPDTTDLRAVNLNPRESAVFKLLDSSEPRGIDALIHASGLKAHEVSATLLVLEVRRLCKQLPGKRFVKA
ncbi:MAG: DNA-protecting protein DprA [Planctomycetes bacterium]|nr:DNA-protecting protein DprA [Planctomycetota bacterium]